MNFTPFAFFGSQETPIPSINNPNDIADLTFWVDFSDTDFYETFDGTFPASGSYMNFIYSKVSGSTSHTLNRWGTDAVYGPTSYLVTQSLSNPSLNCAKVVVRPTSYYATSWSTANNDAIVQGPKTNTTSYPDGMTFMVLNREYNDNLGYLIARWNGSVDRGAFFTENRTGGSYPPKTPQLTIGNYDQNSGIQYFSGSNNTANVILTRENDSATRTIWRGSTQVASDSGNDQQTRTHRQFNSLGRYYNGSTTTSATEQPPLNTYFCEVIQYNRVLTDTERQQVWNYLSDKWNISL